MTNLWFRSRMTFSSNISEGDLPPRSAAPAATEHRSEQGKLLAIAPMEAPNLPTFDWLQLTSAIIKGMWVNHFVHNLWPIVWVLHSGACGRWCHVLQLDIQLLGTPCHGAIAETQRWHIGPAMSNMIGVGHSMVSSCLKMIDYTFLMESNRKYWGSRTKTPRTKPIDRGFQVQPRTVRSRATHGMHQRGSRRLCSVASNRLAHASDFILFLGYGSTCQSSEHLFRKKIWTNMMSEVTVHRELWHWAPGGTMRLYTNEVHLDTLDWKL